MKPYYERDNGCLYNGDSLEVLSGMEDNSVNCCVTSPPYWGLRDYGVNGQLGLEQTPEQYIEKIINIFRQVNRVLKDDGTLWLNLGDSYSGSGGAGNQFGQLKKDGFNKYKQGKITNLKQKDLVGIPWRVAFALQADGWYLRQDIIWSKSNPMPESVKDRCTKAHEYIFLLSKKQKYYYDYEAIIEPLSDGSARRSLRNSYKNSERAKAFPGQPSFRDRGNGTIKIYSGGRNKRSVWAVSTKPFSGAHFAVFPPALIEPCILAGCPKGGIVLDPFIGSGTTAIVAHQYDRKFIGVDLSKKYLDEITIPRIESVTKQRKLF